MKKGFILGFATGLAVASASLVLANSQIQAILNNQIKVSLDGQVQEFRDETTNEVQYPITYKDRTYLPLRTVANLVGVDVDYDANSNTAILTNKHTSNNQESTDNVVKQEYKELKSINCFYVNNLPTISSDSYIYDQYTLVPKHKLEFEHNNKSYKFEIGNVIDDNYDLTYIKYLPTNEVYFYYSNNLYIYLYDFNAQDKNIQLVISSSRTDPSQEDSEANLYNVNDTQFSYLDGLPKVDFITSDGKLGRYIYWLEENVVGMYYQISNDKIERLIAKPNSNISYTVNKEFIGILYDENGQYDGNHKLNPGEKIKILSIENNYLDCKIQRENGDIVTVGQIAGRT